VAAVKELGIAVMWLRAVPHRLAVKVLLAVRVLLMGLLLETLVAVVVLVR
jgi:hypothetical protein